MSKDYEKYNLRPVNAAALIITGLLTIIGLFLAVKDTFTLFLSKSAQSIAIYVVFNIIQILAYVAFIVFATKDWNKEGGIHYRYLMYSFTVALLAMAIVRFLKVFSEEIPWVSVIILAISAVLMQFISSSLRNRKFCLVMFAVIIALLAVDFYLSVVEGDLEASMYLFPVIASINIAVCYWTHLDKRLRAGKEQLKKKKD